MSDKPAKLIVRNAEVRDIPGIMKMSERVYGRGMGYARSELFGQINRFPDGQFVAEYEGVIVGYCATFIISSDVALAPHTWNEITGVGFAARHDPEGDMLYGMDVMVHPDYRRLRIGERRWKPMQIPPDWIQTCVQETEEPCKDLVVIF